MAAKADAKKPVTKKVDTKKAPASAKPTKVVAKRQRKAYTRPQFRRPHTYRAPQTAKPSQNTKTLKDSWDEFRIIRKPLATDVAMKKIEDNNTLTFLVDPLANKTQIKAAVKALYQVKVAKVNTLIRPQGDKKAYVRLAPAHDALDVASKIGVL